LISSGLSALSVMFIFNLILLINLVVPFSPLTLEQSLYATSLDEQQLGEED
jgi:hypothetical protein